MLWEGVNVNVTVSPTFTVRGDGGLLVTTPNVQTMLVLIPSTGIETKHTINTRLSTNDDTLVVMFGDLLSINKKNNYVMQCNNRYMQTSANRIHIECLFYLLHFQ